MTPETLVYRGAMLPLKIFDEYQDIQNKKEKLLLWGFTSTSLKKEEALKFISEELN